MAVVACQSHAPRFPAHEINEAKPRVIVYPDFSEDPLEKYYLYQQERHQLLQEIESAKKLPSRPTSSRGGGRISNSSKVKTLERKLTSLEAKILETKQNIGSDSQGNSQGIRPLVAKWAEEFEFGERGFAKVPVFFMDTNLAQNYELNIKFRLNDNRTRSSPRRGGINVRVEQVKYQMRCDGPFKILGKKVNLEPYVYEGSKVHRSHQNHLNFDFNPGEGLSECYFKVNDTEARLAVFADGEIVQRLDRSNRLCWLPDVLPPASEKQKIFLSTKYHYLSCPEKIESYRSLSDGLEAAEAKLEALAGKKIKFNQLTAANWRSVIDALELPPLKAIYISALVFRFDFSGVIFHRLIERHAERGASIRILVADVISLKKDVQAFKNLSANFPGVKVVFYKWTLFGDSGKGSITDGFHRSNHVKAFVTLSADLQRHPHLAIVGGRNLHDGFVFKSVPEQIAQNQLMYGNELDETWGHWIDYEVQIYDTDFVERIALQVLSQMFADQETFWVRPTSLVFDARFDKSNSQTRPLTQDRLSEDSTYMRHLLSVPYKDNRSLEKQTIELIDSAEESIDISSPYFRPPASIILALERATSRGVNIRILTRLEIGNEFGNFIDHVFNDSNKATVNRLLDAMDIYEYDRTHWLHSKIIVVDKELSFVGSVNLNKRSFIHDTENALMVYSKTYAKELTDLIDDYVKVSQRIDDQLRVLFLSKTLLFLLDDKF